MRGINLLFLLGTLRAEPDQTTSKSGKIYVRFEIDAVSVRHKDGVDDERREVIPVTAFGKLGEVVSKYVKPGDPVHITAHISSSEFKTKAGTIRRSISLIADSIPAGRKQDASGQSRWCGEPSEQPPPKLKQVPLNEHGEPKQLPF